MNKKRKNNSDNLSSSRPSTTIEGREAQLTSLAVNLAEEKLRDGTASSQIIAYFLKKASPREQLELERLREENNLLKAKIEAIKNSEQNQELYAQALEAFSKYKGNAL